MRLGVIFTNSLQHLVQESHVCDELEVLVVSLHLVLQLVDDDQGGASSSSSGRIYHGREHDE